MSEPEIVFAENLTPPTKAKAIRSRVSKYAIGAIKIDGALLVPIGDRKERSMKQALYAAVRNYRKTNPSANFTIAPYLTPAGVAHIGVFRLADTAPEQLQAAAA